MDYGHLAWQVTALMIFIVYDILTTAEGRRLCFLLRRCAQLLSVELVNM